MSRRLRTLLEAGLTFRWLPARVPDTELGKRERRRLARRRPKQERLKAETAKRLRRLSEALSAREARIRRKRKARGRAT